LVLDQGTLTASTSYNVVDSLFASKAAEDDALARSLKDLAYQLTDAVAIALQQPKSAPSAQPEPPETRVPQAGVPQAVSVAGRSIGFDQLCAQLDSSLAVVFYGHNHAWMEEEAAALIAAVKRQNPSLSVSRFGSDVLLKEPYRLQDALTSPGLFSQGRQLAVIDGGDERSGALVAAFLANPCYSPADGLIVLLAPGQHGSARWLQPLKTQAGVWLRDCYDETPAVRTAFVKRYLQSRDKTATPAALDILQSYLPSDRLMACQDLARLCLLAGANPVIEEALVTQALTLQLASDVQEFINAYLDGRLPWLAGHAALVDESALPPWSCCAAYNNI
jgi:hypothetical protein